MIHDAGMLQVDKKLNDSKQVLDQLELLDITKHAVISTDLLFERMEGVPVGIRMVVYQMHERCDGSCYGRQTRGESSLTRHLLRGPLGALRLLFASFRPFMQKIGIKCPARARCYCKSEWEQDLRVTEHVTPERVVGAVFGQFERAVEN